MREFVADGRDFFGLLEHVNDRRIEACLDPAITRWASIIRSDRPAGRFGRWRWRRRWQRAEARAFLYGGEIWWQTIKRANHRAGVWDPPRRRR